MKYKLTQNLQSLQMTRPISTFHPTQIHLASFIPNHHPYLVLNEQQQQQDYSSISKSDHDASPKSNCGQNNSVWTSLFSSANNCSHLIQSSTLPTPHHRSADNINTNITLNTVQKPTFSNLNDMNSKQKKTYYRRQLPSSLISFTSKEGKKLFKESLYSGHAEAYFSLSGNFTHQSEPEFCGLGSLAMVLNALEVDPKRTWKGVWRWYSEDMLECCSPFEQIKKNGINFDEFVCLAKCNGLQVVAKRGDQVSKEEFIHDIQSVVAGPETDGQPQQHMVVSFSRKTLSQTGDGHFSPIGAYHIEKNKVLILDTARFKYPSYFCSVDVLYDALKPIDKVTGRSRGYTLLKRLPRKTLAKINFDRMDWSLFSHVLGFVIPQDLAREIRTHSSLEYVIERILSIIPSYSSHNFPSFSSSSTHSKISSSSTTNMHLNKRGIDLAGGKKQQEELVSKVDEESNRLLLQIESHPLYTIVKRVFLESEFIRKNLENRPVSSILGIDVHGISLEQPHTNTSDIASLRVDMALSTVFLLAAPNRMFCTLPKNLQDKLLTLKNWKGDWKGNQETFLLQQEVEHLSDQITSIMSTYCRCSHEEH